MVLSFAMRSLCLYPCTTQRVPVPLEVLPLWLKRILIQVEAFTGTTVWSN